MVIPKGALGVHARVRSIASAELDDPDAPERSDADLYPKTYGPGDRERAVFDPATKHYPHAFVAPEPALASEQARARFRASNREALQHVLRCACSTGYREQLVLRGSATLASWFGARARGSPKTSISCCDRRTSASSHERREPSKTRSCARSQRGRRSAT